ncbi:MAG: hypothetical protein ACLUKN_12840 [Bacilli bacterium]
MVLDSRAASTACDVLVGTFPKYLRSELSVICTHIGSSHSAAAAQMSSNCGDRNSNCWTPSWISPIPQNPSSLARFTASIERSAFAG